MHLPSLTQHQLLGFWTQLLVLLAAARGCGTLARRVGQPAVVGQLVAGVLVGPSVLGKLWPAAEHLLAPRDAASAAPIDAVAWIGVTLLLVLAGFDTDLVLVRRLGRQAMAVAGGAILCPLAAGAALAVVLPGVLLRPHASHGAFVLFIALSLAISSLPVIASILDELGFMRRNFGQVTVAVGAMAEIFGWIGLGVAAAMATAGRLNAASLVLPIGGIAASLIVAILFGQRIADVVLRGVRRVGGSETDAVSVVILIALGLAALMQAVHSDAVLGAYVGGILVGRSRFFQRGTRQHIESVTMGVFAPIFFATAGLRIDLAGLATGQVAMWAAIILAVTLVTKAAGTYLGAALGHLERREGLAMAVGLNCRGAVGIVVATVGLSVQVLSVRTYTILVLVAIVTSVVAPPLLRAIVRDWRGTPEEQERLEREEVVANNLLVRPGRILVVADTGRPSLDAARVVHAAWPPEAGATILIVGISTDRHVRAQQEEFAEVFPGREIETRPVSDAADVLEEARLGYSVVVLGAPAEMSPDEQAAVNPLADAVLAATHVPVVLVRQPRGERRVPRRFQRVLLPVAGGPASRTAEELAYHLADATATSVVVTHVTRQHPEPVAPALAGAPYGEGGPSAAATGVMRKALLHAQEHDVFTRTSLRHGSSPADEIVEEAITARADVLVMGTTIRALDGRPFLGHTVEQVLRRAEQTVVVVCTPEAVLAGGLTERFDAPV